MPKIYSISKGKVLLLLILDHVINSFKGNVALLVKVLVESAVFILKVLWVKVGQTEVDVTLYLVLLLPLKVSNPLLTAMAILAVFSLVTKLILVLVVFNANLPLR